MSSARPRGTTNRDDRGSTADRLARKLFLLAAFGDGITAPCELRASPKCLTVVTLDTITIDRWPIPGCEGGRYTRDNIRPACGPCNQYDGALLGNQRKQKRAQA